MAIKTVLLVDDNRLVKLANQRLLTRAGYNVITAADGEEAVTAARQAIPDVILLDMMLPKLSGHEVLRLLKNDLATAQIPVIVVTGLSRKNAAKLESEGADAFVEKEELLANADPLLETMERVMREAGLRKQSHMAPDAILAWTPAEIDAAASPNPTPEYSTPVQQ